MLLWRRHPPHHRHEPEVHLQDTEVSAHLLYCQEQRSVVSVGRVVVGLSGGMHWGGGQTEEEGKLGRRADWGGGQTEEEGRLRTGESWANTVLIFLLVTSTPLPLPLPSPPPPSPLPSSPPPLHSPQVPWYVLVMMSLLAYRVHSIFVLRMFNDPVAMVILYASVNAMLYRRWTLASTLYR